MEPSSTRRVPTRTELPKLPGHFYYAELHTTDVDGACAFYREMLGWEYEEVPGVPGRYVTASVEGRPKAAITSLDPELAATGIPPHWLSYLTVPDVDAACARTRALGGEIAAEPMDVFDLGRSAVVKEPTGAWFGIWQDAQPGHAVKDEVGSPFWYELHSADIDRAVEFYRALVGWTTEPVQIGANEVYHLIVPEQGGDLQQNVGGAMQLPQRQMDEGIPSAWYPYMQVEDADAAYAKALELGASSVMQPHDIPGGGRSCWVQDPQGAHVPFMYPEPAAGEQP